MAHSQLTKPPQQNDTAGGSASPSFVAKRRATADKEPLSPNSETGSWSSVDEEALDVAAKHDLSRTVHLAKELTEASYFKAGPSHIPAATLARSESTYLWLV